VFLALFFPLDPGVLDAADLLTVEDGPLLLVEPLIERLYVLQILEVDERVAHVAVVLEIDGQVEEIVGIVEVCVDSLQHQLLGVLVGYIADHEGAFPLVVDLVHTYLELARVLHLPEISLALLLLVVLARLVCHVPGVISLTVVSVRYSLYERHIDVGDIVVETGFLDIKRVLLKTAICVHIKHVVVIVVVVSDFLTVGVLVDRLALLLDSG